MAQALSVAETADVVIAVVGLNADWETEGYDRKTLSLPRRTDELIQKLSEVAKGKLAVVTQAVSIFPFRLVSAYPNYIHRVQQS